MIQIIGMDIANKDSKDFSAISVLCSNCKTFIHNEIFKENTPTMEYPKECPSCGVKFTNQLICK